MEKLIRVQNFYFIDYFSQSINLKPVPEWSGKVKLGGSGDSHPDFALGDGGSGEAVRHKAGQTALSVDVSGEDITIEEAGHQVESVDHGRGCHVAND